MYQFMTKNLVVRCRRLDEDSPDLSWDDDGTIRAQIDNGDLDLFTVEVTVADIQTGAVLGSDYLGNCVYESFRDFYSGENRNGYFRDMIREACREARKNLDHMRTIPLRT